MHDLNRILLGELGSIDNLVKELSALEEVHDEVKVDFILVNFVEFDDIAVVHLLKHIDFALEPLDLFGVAHAALLNELDCPLKARDLVDASAHLSVGALAKLLLNFIIVSKGVQLLLYETQLGYFVEVGPRVHRGHAGRLRRRCQRFGSV